MTIALRGELVRDEQEPGLARFGAVLRRVAGRFALPVAIGGIVAGLFLVAVALLQWAHDATLIDSVRVEGSFRAETQTEIERSMSSLVAGHSLLGVPVEEIVRELSALSWVNEVDVYRVWPHGLIVRVTEKVPVAHWNDTGFISHAGDVFQPDNGGPVSGLPKLAGPADKAAQVMAFYSAVNGMLAGAGLSVSELRLNEQLSWEIVLANGIRLRLDQDDAQTRLRRFLRVYQQRLAAAATDIDSIDLRYIGGFAVRWIPVAARTSTVLQAGALAPGGTHGANGQ